MGSTVQPEWTEERKDRLREFLENHRLAMLHCDMEFGANGRCECMERLAEYWAEQEAIIETAHTLLRRCVPFIEGGRHPAEPHASVVDFLTRRGEE